MFVCRKLLSEYTSITMDQWNLITLGMTSVSLVVAVVQLALISSTKAEEMYRHFVGKMACCHFSLVSVGVFVLLYSLIVCIRSLHCTTYVAVTTITAAYGWHVILLDKNS